MERLVRLLRLVLKTCADKGNQRHKKAPMHRRNNPLSDGLKVIIRVSDQCQINVRYPGKKPKRLQSHAHLVCSNNLAPTDEADPPRQVKKIEYDAYRRDKQRQDQHHAPI